MIRNVFFDLIYTLVHFDMESHSQRCCEILSELGRVEPRRYAEEFRRAWVGYSERRIEGDESFYSQILSGLGLPFRRDLVPALREAYMDSLSLYRDSIWALKDLLGRYKLGLITNGVSSWYERVLEKFSLKGYFDSIIISSAVGCRKPCRRIYEAALESLNAKAEESFFISDEYEEDLLPAMGIGMRVCLLNRGGGPAPGPVAVARDLPEALALIG
ncbi:MAG: HAD family hydrolase [Candidatus Bathyarchaeia archaeon]